MLQQFAPTADKWDAVVTTTWNQPGLPPERQSRRYPVVGFALLKAEVLTMVADGEQVISLKDARFYAEEYAKNSRPNYAHTFKVTADLERV